MGGFEEIVRGLMVFYTALVAAVVFALLAVAVGACRLAKAMKPTSKGYDKQISDQEARVILTALGRAKTTWTTQADRETAEGLARKLLNFRIKMKTIDD